MDMSCNECRNIKLVLSYDGSFYNGWQRQRNTENTIQGILERILSKVLSERIKVIGAGRTDAGVHALRQVANFKTRNFSIPHDKFKVILNSSLPKSIRVINSEEVPLDFNSRFSAKFRKYLYFVFLGDEKLLPFFRNYSYVSLKRDFDIGFMRSVVGDFVGEHDFRYVSSPGRYKSTIRFVRDLKVFRFRDFLVFSITANGFMYKMARGIVSILIESENRKDPFLVRKVLSGCKVNGLSLVPSSGLYLHRVYY
ncbi:MAG: tRNA pseudouridine(38-40) synthase TruA [Brevinematia bacterium]